MVMLARLTQVLCPGDIETSAVRCSRNRASKSGCSRCADVCPVDAIDLSCGLRINDSCEGCGACVPACPNGVFVPTGRTDTEILREIENVLKDGGRRIVLTCDRMPVALDKNVVTLPCVGGLTEEVLIGAWILGARQIQVARCTDGTCKLSKAVCRTEEVVENAEWIIQAFGDTDTKIERLDNDNFAGDTVREGAEREITRRELFEGFRRSSAKTASRAVSEIEKLTVGKNGRKNPGRDLLLGLLAQVRDKKGESVLRRLDSLPFAEIEINGDCSGCEVCSTVCPVGALKWTEHEKRKLLQFSTHLCTACRACVESCHLKAIGFSDSFRIEHLIRHEVIELANLTEFKCAQCSMKSFGRDGETICFVCKQRKER